LQICRVSAAIQFQTIAAKTWRQTMQKARNHAGIPSKIEIFLKQKIQNIFLQQEKNPASRRET